MINRRRVCGGKKGLLPSGYTQVEYIENTSTAYINTGVNGALSNSYEIKFNFPQIIIQQVILGDWYPSNTSTLNTASNNGTMIIKYSVGDLWLVEIAADTNVHIFKYDGNTKKAYIDGISNGKVATRTSGQKQYLFASNYSDAAKDYAKVRVYYCKMESNGELVRNFIPCISPTNVVGIYDTVEGKFYSSPNGVAFVAGPVV